MIVDFPGSGTGGGPATAEGVYPGGQSENPASPWYANLIADWWDGRYLPMPSPRAGEQEPSPGRFGPLRPRCRAAVADLRKLGKRGSYRLGARLNASDGRPSAGRPASRGVRFGPQPDVRPGWWLAATLAGVAVIAVTAESGLWFVPFAVGLVTGVAAPRAGWRLRHALPAVIVMAAVGWALPLLWQAVRGEPAVATARVIAALAGRPPHAAAGIIITLLVPSLQAVVGLWLGRAATPRNRRPLRRRQRGIGFVPPDRPLAKGRDDNQQAVVRGRLRGPSSADISPSRQRASGGSFPGRRADCGRCGVSPSRRRACGRSFLW